MLEIKHEIIMQSLEHMPIEFYEKHQQYQQYFESDEMSSEDVTNAYSEMISFAQQNDISVILEMCEWYGIEEIEKVAIEEQQWLGDNMVYEMLPVELPISFVVFTDSSGNNVESETMVYPDFALDIEKRTREYILSRLNFVLGSTRKEQIYDTTYNCIDLRGDGSFLTREIMDIDTLNSKNVLIDLSDSEMKELFKDEFTLRFE